MSAPTQAGGSAGGQGDAADNRWLMPISAVSFGVAAVIAIYWEPAAAAVSVWTNSATYRASYFVIPIAL